MQYFHRGGVSFIMNIRWFCNQLLQGLMLPSSADLSQMYPENVIKLITIKSEEQKMRCIAKKTFD